MTTPETASQTTRRRVVGSLSALVLILILAASAVISPVMHPGPGASGGPRLNSTADLLRVRGLSGTVATLGTVSAGDGGAMSYSVTDSLPAGDLGDIAVPLVDGRWAVPEGLPTAPRTVPDPAAVEDTVARAMTFAAAGEALHWDSGRATPLSDQVVHDTQTRPYAVTASAFVGMVLRGWDYEHTTYVVGGNTQVGQAVDFGTTSGAELGQASRLARWFYAHGDLWLDTDGQYQRGDVLFFSNQEHAGTQPGGAPYFGNVYHTAVYLGDGRLVHATGPTTSAGVHVDALSPSLQADLTFVARPHGVTVSTGLPDQGNGQHPQGNGQSDQDDGAPGGAASAQGDGSQATRTASPDGARGRGPSLARASQDGPTSQGTPLEADPAEGTVPSAPTAASTSHGTDQIRGGVSLAAMIEERRRHHRLVRNVTGTGVATMAASASGLILARYRRHPGQQDDDG
ncbi:hypothetical protein [Actinomyces sp. oral taxon 897]|uniref:hypothetical protein n=1 Tax=Actinomyces sp. oral taxon 897 TaxID=2081702 RepID=UPI00101AD76B|nr:hypothetical protein [Actinomyces sp. oral taxon 897]